MTLKTLAAATCLTLCTATAGLATTLTSSGTFGEGEIAVFEFTLGSGGTYLDLTTNGSTDVDGGGPADTEIALYFGTGSSATLVPSASNGDDDDGIGLSATLTYGVGSGMVLGDAGNLGPGGVANGEDGALPAAGVYTVVIGEFSTIFEGTIGEIVDFGEEAVDYQLSIFSDATLNGGPAAVPLPASLPLLLAGLGGVGALRLRKKRAA